MSATPTIRGTCARALSTCRMSRPRASAFAAGIEQVMQLVPADEHDRVEQRLRNTAELAFLLHGMEFARVRIGLAPNSFAQTLEVTAGVGPNETPLTTENRAQLSEMVAELFARRRAVEPSVVFARRPLPTLRRIGSPMTASAHARMQGARRGRRHGYPGSALSPPHPSAGWSRCCGRILRRSPAVSRLIPQPHPSGVGRALRQRNGFGLHRKPRRHGTSCARGLTAIAAARI